MASVKVIKQVTPLTRNGKPCVKRNGGLNGRGSKESGKQSKQNVMQPGEMDTGMMHRGEEEKIAEMVAAVEAAAAAVVVNAEERRKRNGGDGLGLHHRHRRAAAAVAVVARPLQVRRATATAMAVAAGKAGRAKRRGKHVERAEANRPLRHHRRRRVRQTKMEALPKTPLLHLLLLQTTRAAALQRQTGRRRARQMQSTQMPIRVQQGKGKRNGVIDPGLVLGQDRGHGHGRGLPMTAERRGRRRGKGGRSPALPRRRRRRRAGGRVVPVALLDRLPALPLAQTPTKSERAPTERNGGRRAVRGGRKLETGKSTEEEARSAAAHSR